MKEHIEVIVDGVKAGFVSLGEGCNGDYDPEDPDDELLLRFDVELRTDDGGGWVAPQDASYCTNVPVTTDPKILVGLLYEIAREAADAVSHGTLKRTLEALSWINADAPVLSITFSELDIIGMAEQAGVDREVALDRARSWSKAIGDTLTEMGNEQFASIVEFDQP